MKMWFSLVVKGDCLAAINALQDRGIDSDTTIDTISGLCRVTVKANWADVEAWFLQRGKVPFADGTLLTYRNVS